MKRKVSLLLLIVSISCFLVGCYDAVEIGEEVYAIAIGIDEGVNNKVRLSIQYMTYSEGTSGGGSEKSADGMENKNKQEGSIVHSIEAPTILEALDMFGMAISRRVSLKHAKYIVISEPIAKTSVAEYVQAIKRYYETRPSMFFIVSNCKAEEFLLNNSSNIGGTISKSMESLFSQNDNMSYFPAVSFRDFSLNDTHYSTPIAIYAGINDFKAYDPKSGGDSEEKPKEGSAADSEKKPKENSEEASTDSSKKGEEPKLEFYQGFKPGEVPRKGVAKREFVGTAVFKNQKMVGSLDSYETFFYSIATSSHKSGAITIPNTEQENKGVVLNLRSNGLKTTVEIDDQNNVTINRSVSVEVDIESSQGNNQYNKENINDLHIQLEDVLKEGITKVIEKTQKEYNADIFGFGKNVSGKFLTIQEWEDFNWNDKYEKAQINVNIHIDIRRSGLIIH